MMIIVALDMVLYYIKEQVPHELSVNKRLRSLSPNFCFSFPSSSQLTMAADTMTTPLDNYPKITMTREDILLSVTHLRYWTNELREAESQWPPAASLLVTELFETASRLGIDGDTMYDVELHLLKEIEALEAKLRRRVDDLHMETTLRNTLYERQGMLAAVRDLSNTLDWVVAPEREFSANPTSWSLPDIRNVETRIKDGRLPEEKLTDLHSQVLATAIAVSGKTASLQGEVKKAKDLAEVIGTLYWGPDEAPLTKMLLFT
ncbi:hypothetical protein B0I37DRAFT_52111 [Chaetomium sp. MPI-CAGE-AT-0009]|nr:hypothetical protein B0I37DRAFT_52111 [Chaetomium sp. MPI-CAGE-AT-0009]